MKKWWIGLLVVVLLGLSAFYLVIPSTLKLSRHVVIDCSIYAANRYLLEPENWVRWWPGRHLARPTDSSQFGRYQNGGYTYTIAKLLYNRVQLAGSNSGDTLQSFLNTIPFSRDTIAVEWTIEMKTSGNPFKRFQQYRKAHEMDKNMGQVLDALHDFLHDKDKVYGVKLQRILNGERSLLVMDSVLTTPPSITQVYAWVEELRKVMRQNGAKEINYPMLHVSQKDSTHYFMMVAVQTNIKIERTGHIYYKHTYPGYTLVSQVTGGPHQVNLTIAKLQTYVQDYQIVSPAIPYAEMVTDRLKVTDTSKWISRVYLPVF